MNSHVVNKLSDNASNGFLQNPYTGRKMKIDGPTHKNLQMLGFPNIDVENLVSFLQNNEKDGYTINPCTKKKIKIGGAVHKKLLKVTQPPKQKNVKKTKKQIGEMTRDEIVAFLDSHSDDKGYTINPITNRKIKVNGKPYKRLMAVSEDHPVRQLPSITPSDPTVSLVYNLRDTAIKGFKRTYSITVPKNTINSVGKGYFEYLQSSIGITETILQTDYDVNGPLSFRSTLIVEFGSMDPDLENKIAYFHSDRYFLTNLDKVEDDVIIAHTKILNSIEKFLADGSGWVVNKILDHNVNISVYKPLKGSSYIETPKEISNPKKGLINPQNTKDNECFRWCHMIHLAINGKIDAGSRDFQRISKYKKFLDKVNYDNIEFPVKTKVVPKIEEQNKIKINLFCYQEKDTIPLYISKAKYEDEMNLLMISDGPNNHYIYMKDFNSYMYNQTHHKERKHFCMYCLQCFSKEHVLKDHKNVCMAVNKKQTIEMPHRKNGELPCVKFRNFGNQLKNPFVVYADFESIIKNQKDLKEASEKTFSHEFQNHEACGFAYKVVCMDPRFTKDTYVYRGPDAGREFLRKILEEEKVCQDIIKKHFNKPMELTPQDEADFKSGTQCHICKGVEFTEKDYKVRDHCHISGKYRGVAHRTCNLNFQVSTKIPVVFHNLRGYDGHIIMQNIGEFVGKDYKVDVIPNSMERYMAFFLGPNLKFIDSFQFMSSSLDSLSKNLKDFPLVKSEFDDIELITKKGIYPYEYMNSFERFDETKLPDKGKFYSTLTDKHITWEEYHHARDVWKKFNIKSLGEYHDLYLKTDVLLLADVFENFRNVCMSYYELDPAHYFTSPGLSWDALLKMTGQKLELLTNIDMHLMFESGTRGGVSYISHRHAAANNKYMKDYNPEQESSYIMYLDANNLYGCAMSESLPTGNFKWGDVAKYDLNKYGDGKGAVLKVDLRYPKPLHDLHNDYPLAPEQLTPESDMLSDYCKEISTKFKIKTGQYRKLIPNLQDKKEYVVHYKNLRQYLDLGLEVTKVHKILEFDESPWMSDYISFNTEKRKTAKNDFEKNFFKLMNNSVFGKTMENLRKRVNIKLTSDPEKFKQLASRPTYVSSKVFSKGTKSELVAVHILKPKLVLNRPIYVGMSILDLSKTVMYDFHYNHIKKKYGNNARLLFTDTDSLTYQIFTKDIYEDIWMNKEKFDFSDYPKESKYHDITNKKVLGKFKDEAAGEIITEFVGLRSEMYSYKKTSGKATQTAKGITKTAKERDLNHQMYKDVLFEKKETRTSMNIIKSLNHQIKTYQVNKKSLSCFDDKRYILEDGVTSLAYGHQKILIKNLDKIKSEMSV